VGPQAGWRLALAAGGAALLSLAALGAGAAFVLPSARITITPQALPIGPAAYTIALDAREERTSGALTLSAAPTGERIERVAASGRVVFSNWNTVPVEIAAGTGVAADKVEFETTESIMVPAAQLGLGLRVVPGQASAPIVAAEPGPPGNVDAGAIDTIVSQRLRAYLRGFANNRQELVGNPEPTGGGSETPISVVTASDVNVLVAGLRKAATDRAAVEIGARPERLFVPFADGDLEFAADVPPQLVGAEGLARFELSASWSATYRFVDRDEVEAHALDLLAADDALVPGGYEVLADVTRVRLGAPRLENGRIVTDALVSGQAAPIIDLEALTRDLAGRTPHEAMRLLAPYGDAEVSLWPDWATTIPSLAWRVSLEADPVRGFE